MKHSTNIGMVIRSLSMEDAVVDSDDAETVVELERTYYGKLVDASDLLKAASSVEQEQWSVSSKLPEGCKYGGAIRVRSINDETFVMCIKNYEHGKRGVLEHEFEINREGFEAVRRISPSGMRKTRYCFPIEGTEYCWEVDVFKDADGNLAPWVKVDLEVNDLNFQVPEFPVRLENAFEDAPHKRSPEMQKVVENLYSKYMSIPNQYPID